MEVSHGLASASSDARTNDCITDVIVVGSGGAGLSSAIVAASEGLQVTVIEKSRYIGGTTAMSGGGVWIPANAKMRAAGDDDSPEAALAYLRQILEPDADTSLLESFLRQAPDALEYLQQHSRLQFSTRKYSPDYYSDLAWATRTSRAVDNREFDGRELGSDLDLLQPARPETLLFGGMPVNGMDMGHLSNALRTWPSFRHCVRLVAAYCVQKLRYGQSIRLVLGRALIGRMLASVRELGVSIETSTMAVELIAQQGRVLGLIATSGGSRRRMLARRGVVLATGGFAYHPALRARWIPHSAKHLAVGATTNEGDGITLATAIGAMVDENARDSAYWTPVSEWSRPDGSRATFPHLVTDRAKPGLIAVDASGKRFVNESASYHDFVRAMHARDAVSHCVPCFLVCDSRFLRRYGLGHARPWPFPHRHLVRDDYLVTDPTLEGLAVRLALPKGALEETVARFNVHAVAGADPEFGKGSTAYNRFMGDASHLPQPCLAPIRHGPFYAVRIYPGNVGTCRGLRTDALWRVLDQSNVPIDGLYAIGNDADSVLMGTYPGPGASLGPALTAGYTCSMHMARPLSAT